MGWAGSRKLTSPSEVLIELVIEVEEVEVKRVAAAAAELGLEVDFAEVFESLRAEELQSAFPLRAHREHSQVEQEKVVKARANG